RQELTRAARVHAIQIPEGGGMSDGSHDSNLSGDVYVLAPAGGMPIYQRGQRSHGRLRSHPSGALLNGNSHGLAVFFARKRHGPAERHDLQIGSLKIPIGTFLSIGSYRNQ